MVKFKNWDTIVICHICLNLRTCFGIFVTLSKFCSLFLLILNKFSSKTKLLLEIRRKMLQEVHYNLNNWVGFLGIHFEVGGGGGG